MHCYAGVILVVALCINVLTAQPVSLAVNLSSRHAEQGLLVGGGIEDANHELYGGLYSQMVFGESFEEPPGYGHVSGGDVFWGPMGNESNGLQQHASAFQPLWVRGGNGTYNISQDAFNGIQSQSVMNGSILNLGVSQQGMHFQAGRDYTGHLYAKVQKRARITVRLISIVADSGKTELAATSFKLGASSQWTRLNFQLVPSVATFCSVTHQPRGTCLATPELNTSCYQCSGGLEIEVEGGPVLLDMVYLEPGEWGRYQGLPIRRDVAEAMFGVAGWQVVRLGGTMVCVDGYRWKNFRGPRSLRANYRGFWYPWVSAGFRIFETLELCEAAGVACAITINNLEDPEDMADFVEYCFGDVSTTWGFQRSADGREQPYKPFTVEIGNEQSATDDFVANVRSIATAMTSRARRLKLAFPLQFAIGQNIGMSNLVPPGLNFTLKMLDAVKTLDANVSWDAHIGGWKLEDADDWMQVVNTARSVFEAHQSKMRMVVLEENSFRHDLMRALVHARMNIMSSYSGGFMLLDTAASGLQLLGQNENGWDQAQVFMTPDKAWLSPFGWSQWMLKQHAEFNVPVNITTGPHGFDVGAYISPAGAVGLRVVNWGADLVNCTILVPLELSAVPEIHAYELASSKGDLKDINPPYDQLRVSPRKVTRGAVRLVPGGFVVGWQYPPRSFVTMAFRPMGASPSVLI